MSDYNFSFLTDLDIVILLKATKEHTPEEKEFIEALQEELKKRQHEGKGESNERT